MTFDNTAPIADDLCMATDDQPMGGSMERIAENAGWRENECTSEECTISERHAAHDVYVWTARKDGTGKPVCYDGPMTDTEAFRVCRNYPGSLTEIVVYISPAEHEPYVRAAVLAYWSQSA